MPYELSNPQLSIISQTLHPDPETGEGRTPTRVGYLWVHRAIYSLLKAIDRVGNQVADAAKRAENLWWVTITGAPSVLKVTDGDRQRPITQREALEPNRRR